MSALMVRLRPRTRCDKKIRKGLKNCLLAYFVLVPKDHLSAASTAVVKCAVRQDAEECTSGERAGERRTNDEPPPTLLMRTDKRTRRSPLARVDVAHDCDADLSKVGARHAANGSVERGASAEAASLVALAVAAAFPNC